MGSGFPVTVSLVMSALSEDVWVAISFEASKLNGRWYVQWNGSDQGVRVNCKRGMGS